MNAAARLLMTAMAASGVAFPLAAAQVSDDPGSKGTLTVNFTFKGTAIGLDEFKGRTTFNQTATMVCLLVAGDIAPTSYIQGPTPEQKAARARLDAVSPEGVADLKYIELKMDACRASGKDDRTCGKEVMAAMWSDPQYLNRKRGTGNADPKAKAAAESAFAAVAGKFQAWLNESCSGTMTVDNSRQLDDPTIPGPEPIVKTTGTRKFRTRDPLVTIETDFDRNETRYDFLSPQASGFQREPGHGKPGGPKTIIALPVAHVIAGPHQGPIQSGRHEKTLSIGIYVIEWTFARTGR